MSAYTVIIEDSKTGFSAYIPDLPGCVATGRTREEVLERIAGGMKMHLEAMRAHNEPIPEPTSHAVELPISA